MGQFGGEVELFGGEASPAPPPLDETLYTYIYIISGMYLRMYIHSTYYTRQSGIWPDISRAIFSRAEGECKYTSEMSGHITR